VASLLAPFARPAETELYRDMVLPQALAEALERWETRPAITWVRTIYRDYRRAAACGLPGDAMAADGNAETPKVAEIGGR
jgi:hypothetical protein